MADKFIPRRKSLKLFALAGTTILTVPKIAFSQMKKDEKIRFGILADSHYADRDPAGSRYYREAKLKMREAIKELNDHNLDFVVHLGDFKDEGPEQNPQETLGFLKDIETEFQKFDGAVYHCIGNHDVDSITKGQFLDHIKNTDQTKAESYFSFDNNGMHFIILDANYDAAGKDQFYAEGADWQKTFVPDFEMEWLQNDLKNTEMPCVVFCHHPLYEYHKEGYTFNVHNHKEVRHILEASEKVVAAFHGHVHQEDFNFINGIHYITQLGMVDYQGLQNNSFAIAEISDDKISIRGFNRASSRELQG